MASTQPVPNATAYRLSLYHCYLGELLRAKPDGGITSRTIAEDLDLKEETVRRDISFIGTIGRPGAGYKTADLFAAIQEFLGIKEQYPTMRVGSAEMLRALDVVFPPEAYGVLPVALYSQDPEDAGEVIDELTVQHVSAIPEIDAQLEVRVALVACSPDWAQTVLDLCAEAGVEGVLMLTPILRLQIPEGINVTQIRMPCDIKSLACRCKREPGAELE